MKYGGSVIYHGRLGRRSRRLIEYFKAVPGVPDLQEGLNPATWMLQVSTPGMESTLGVDFAEVYQRSALCRCHPRLQCEIHLEQGWPLPSRLPLCFSSVENATQERIAAVRPYLLYVCRRNEELLERLAVPTEGHEPLQFETKFAQNYSVQFKLIFWKFWMSYWRNPQYNATRFLFAGVLAFLLGSILWKVGHKK